METKQKYTVIHFFVCFAIDKKKLPQLHQNARIDQKLVLTRFSAVAFEVLLPIALDNCNEIEKKNHLDTCNSVNVG